MRQIFREQYEKAKKRPHITDTVGRSVLESVLNTCNDSTKAMEVYSQASRDRLGTTREQHKAAYAYLALAFALLEDASLVIEDEGVRIDSGNLFHFAGHALREIGQLNRAGDSYWRAGVMSKGGATPSSFGIRSIAKAKVAFAAVGATQQSDDMHVLEWEARRQTALWWQSSVLYLWRATSRYGTSAGRWILFTFAVVGASTWAYELMHSLRWIHQGQQWTPWLSAFYYCIVTMTTLGYGEFVPCHPAAQAFVVLNVLVGYFLLAVGATILGRKVIAR